MFCYLIRVMEFPNFIMTREKKKKTFVFLSPTMTFFHNRIHFHRSSPYEPPDTQWKTAKLPICCTNVSPGLSPPTRSESSSFSITLSAAHSADKVLDSPSPLPPLRVENGNLNQCCRINSFLTFDFKASWTQTALTLQ